MQIFFSPQTANLQILELIPQSQIPKFLRCASLQIRKFVIINPQIRKFPWFPNLQISNLQIFKEKTVFLFQIHTGFCNIIFYLPKYVLDWEMPCNVEPSQKPKVDIKFELKHLKLIFEKKYLLIICPQIAGPQITKNKRSANRKSGTYLRTAHLCLEASPSIGHATSFFALCQRKTRPIQTDECRRNNESRERKDYVIWVSYQYSFRAVRRLRNRVQRF